MPGRRVGATGGDAAAAEADRSPMALRRALEMLKAGERINDQLYRSTVDGPRRSPLLVWVYEPGLAPVGAGLTREAAQGA